MSDTIEVFISYSKQDKALRDGLLSHLRPLEGAGIITWHDRQILPGTQWDAEIKARLNAADIILLLISADFLATDYCTQVEIPAALQRHKAGEATVMPVILRSCAWKFTPLRDIQAYPEKAKPIVSWEHIDEAYTDVVDSVDLAATKIKERRSQQRAEQERIQRERQRQAEEQERLRQAEQLRQQQAAEESRLKQLELERQQQEQLKSAAVRSQQLAPQQNQSLDATKGNYTQLEALLKAGKWKEADQETNEQICQVMGRRYPERWLRAEDIEQFPCADLRAIDQLWVTHSKGKFGFSVQKKI
jgi:flagellar biosynthesis GTPase FlhF